MTFRIIIGNPQAFAGPRHTQLEMRIVRLARNVKHARLAPMHQVIRFPNDEIRAGMTSPLEPACIITAEHSQIRGNHIPSSSLRITNDMRVTHTSGANGRRQYRLAIVKRNPTTRIVAIGKIHIDLFRIAVRIFDEVDEQVAEWVVCCGHDVTLLLISFVFRVACVRRVSKALRLGCEKGCRMTTAAL